MLFLYTVINDESLKHIADKFKCTEQKIKELNFLDNDDIFNKQLLIYSEQELPSWMAQNPLCFIDMTPEQLDILKKYYQKSQEDQYCDDDQYCDAQEQKAKCEPENKNEDNKSDVQSLKQAQQGHTNSLTNIRRNDLDAPSRQDEQHPHKKTGSQQYGMVHIVKENETLSDIAEKYGLTSNILLRYGAPEKISVGMRIEIPPIQGRRYFYTVKIGDTVEKLAARFGCAKEKIIKTNLLNENEELLAGTGLVILV